VQRSKRAICHTAAYVRIVLRPARIYLTRSHKHSGEPAKTGEHVDMRHSCKSQVTNGIRMVDADTIVQVKGWLD
jgi:hypothetical protein